MGGDQLREGGGEARLVGEGVDRGSPGGVPREEGGEGVQVVVVDAVDVWVRDDDVGQVAEGLDAVGEADGEEGEGEVCGGEQGLFGEGRAAIPGMSVRNWTIARGKGCRNCEGGLT